MTGLLSIVDMAEFHEEWSHHDDPPYPTNLNFWKTLSADDKMKLTRPRADGVDRNPWNSRTGKGYMNALSNVRAMNARSRYWLPIMLKEAEEEGDEVVVEKIRHCLETFPEHMPELEWEDGNDQ